MGRSIGECAHAGQNHRIGSANLVGIVGNAGVATYRTQTAFHAFQVPFAIINNGNHRLLYAFLIQTAKDDKKGTVPFLSFAHHRASLVKGSSSAMRGLISNAWHIARPTALKHASTM